MYINAKDRNLAYVCRARKKSERADAFWEGFNQNRSGNNKDQQENGEGHSTNKENINNRVTDSLAVFRRQQICILEEVEVL